MKTLKNLSHRSSTWFHQSHHCPHSSLLIAISLLEKRDEISPPACCQNSAYTDMNLRLCLLLHEGRCPPPANVALISSTSFSGNVLIEHFWWIKFSTSVLWFDLITTSVVGEAKNHNKEYSNLHSDKKQNELVSTVKAKLRIHYRRKNDQWNWPGRPGDLCQPLTPLRGGQCPPGGEE